MKNFIHCSQIGGFFLFRNILLKTCLIFLRRGGNTFFSFIFKGRLSHRIHLFQYVALTDPSRPFIFFYMRLFFLYIFFYIEKWNIVKYTCTCTIIDTRNPLSPSLLSYKRRFTLDVYIVVKRRLQQWYMYQNN